MYLQVYIFINWVLRDVPILYRMLGIRTISNLTYFKDLIQALDNYIAI